MILRGHALLSAVAILLFASSAPASSDGSPDILGLKLGMTEAEVKGILSPDKGWRSEVEQVTYNYSDGVNVHRAPPLVNVLTAGQTRLSAHDLGVFMITFSHVPGDQRVVAIQRTVQSRNAPAVEAAEKAVIEKYGEPAARGGGVVTSATQLVWGESGRAACWRGALEASPGTTFDDLYYETLERKHARGEWDLPPSLGDCGYVLSVTMTTPIATMMDVRVVDYGAMYRSAQAAKQWVEELEAKAVQERKAREQVPRL